MKLYNTSKRYGLSFVLLCLLLSFSQLSLGQLAAGFTVNGQAVTEGDTINVCRLNSLTYQSTAIGYTTINWQFHLGTPPSSTLPTPPAITYNTNGIDSTIQIVSDGVNSDTFFVMIKVTDVKPTVDFTHLNNICSGIPIQFTSTVSSGTPPYTYAWVFGGGGTSNLANPVHTFTSLGCGTTNLNNTLTVTDATGCASTVVTHPINILQAPDVELQDPDIISPFSNCENSPTPGNPLFPLTINNISPSAGCISSYTLNWGDGSPLLTGLTNASFPLNHTYTTIGSFNLVVTALAINGCSSSKTYTVANQTNPAGSLGTLGSTSNLCVPAIVPFTISNWQINSTGTIYSLNFGDGPPLILTHPLNPGFTTDTIYHTYTLSSCPANSFTALLTITNACGSTPYTAGNIQVRIKPTAAFNVAPNPACVGQNVCFTNTSLPGAGVNCSTTAGFIWDFGDGSPTSNVMNPCHIYATAGTYTVTLTGNNFCGSSTTTRLVCITGPPTPSFTLDTTNGCIPFAVNATNTSIDPAVCGNATYLWTVAYTAGFCGISSSWNFTNGTTATSINPSFVFNNPGTYTITLAVINPCGSFTTNKVVIIKKPPTVVITAIPNACGTIVINPLATVNACTPVTPTYAWTFQGGIPATATTLNPGPVTFSGVGAHIVSLSVTNECGTITNSTQFNIDTVSTADAGPAQNLCGTTVTMAAVAPIIGTATWTLISGPNVPVITTPSSPNTTITGMIPGTYVFRWAIISGSCTSTSNVSIIIVAGPTPAVAGPNQDLCLANSTTMAANAPVIGTGVWTLVSGPNLPAITNASSPTTTITGLITGVYIFRWTISFSNCTPSTNDVRVTVFDNPSVSNAGSDQVICASTATLTGNAPAIGTGQWIFVSGPGGSSITNYLSPTTTVTLLTPGTYNFRWSISNGTCPPSNDTVEIVVAANPTLAAAGPDQSLCAATSTTLAANTAVIGTGVWSYVSGPILYNITSPSLPNTTVTGLQTGTYVFRWTISNSVCPSTTDDVQITVYDNLQNLVTAPVVTICAGQSVTINGAIPTGGTGTYTYLWEQNDGTGWVTAPPVATAQSYTATPPVSMSYRRKVTSLPCETFSNVIFITVQAAVANNIISADQGICTNTAAATIIGSTPTGGNNIYTYVWEDSTTLSGVWTVIAGATNINYNPGVLTQTTFYRRKVSTSLCNGPQQNISVPVKITVHENSQAVYTAAPLTGCAPFDLSTVINVTPFPDRNGLYSWYADGVLFGSNTTGVFPGLIMNTPGGDTIIKLVTTSQFGCKADSIERQFFTFPTAIAQFNRAPANGCGPLAVTFVNTSNIFAGTQFFWNFGNGVTSTLPQPGTVVYNINPMFRDSTYYITLKAYNGCDTTVWLDSVRVRADAKARFGVDTTFGCSPFTAHITNTSLGGPSTYYWDFGNGTYDTTYTLTSFNVVYNTGITDTFTIRLIAVNECRSDTSYITLVVAPNIIQPQISASGNQLFGCVPHTVTFNNASTGATNLIWTFGDGSPSVNTSAQQSTVQHTYLTAGIFTVSVELLNGCSDTTVYLQVQVFAKPIADFVTNGNIFCAADTVRFTNISQNANAWRWDFGDGNTSSLQNPTHTYATGGTYTVTLWADKVITQGIVCSDTKQLTITVTSKPPANISSNSAGQHCIPYTLTATALGLGNEIATWYITDTTVTPSVIIINGINAQYTYQNPGTFSAKLVVVNSAGCTDSAVINFTVKNKPSSAFSPLNVSTCKNDTTILHINNTTYTGFDPLQYRWLVDNQLVATSVNLTYRYQLGALPLPYTFNTFLITSNTLGCSDTARGTVIMQQPPKALFSLINQNTCVPFVLQVANTATGATSYKWLLNGVQVSTAVSPTFLISQPNTPYIITLIADNNFGCKPDTLTRVFTTLPKPKAIFKLSDSLSCNGSLNIAVNNQSTGANNYTWIWSDGSPNSNFTNPTHLYTALGIFPVILIAGDGTCRDTTSLNVRIANKPVVNFSVNKTEACGTVTVTFTNLSTLASAYLWDFGDGTFSNQNNPVKIFPPRATPYTVKLVATGTYGCKDSLVKANFILAKPLPIPAFVVSPANIIAVPNYTFKFINTTLQNNNYSYFWKFGDNGIPATTRDASHRYLDTGKYLVNLIVFDKISNCTDTASQFVQITGFPGYLYVPNAFQPGSLQPILKTFLPIGTGLATYRLQIFTTWGQKVFETASLDAKGAPNEGWNGLYNGKDNFNQGKAVQQDIYIWRIDAVFKNGTEWKGMSYPNQSLEKRIGTVTLIR